MTIRASLSLRLLLLATLFLHSCITIDKKLGDNLIPINQDLSLKFQLFDLPIDSKPTDSLPTNKYYPLYDENMPMLFGTCQDPLFGTTKTGTVFQFTPSTAFSYGDQPEPVSLTITFVVQNHIVLDQNQSSIPQNVFVHEITSDLSFKTAFNNSLQLQDWDPQPISQPGQVYFGTDTLSIALSLDYAKKLLSATQEEKDSLALFTQRFKGLYLQTESPHAGDRAGRINMSSLYSTQMVLKYRLNGADSTLTYYPNGYAFNSIMHTNASIDPHPSQNIYYQGLAGPKPYVDFVALTRSIQTWADQSQIDKNKLLISRAEIVLSYDPAIDYQIINQYPSQLYLFTHTSTDSTSIYQPIANMYASNADGMINRSKFSYSFVITSYLQSLLKKEEVTERDNAWLMEAAYTVVDEYSGTGVYHYSTYTYPLATFKGTATDAKPILKITYSVLK